MAEWDVAGQTPAQRVNDSWNAVRHDLAPKPPQQAPTDPWAVQGQAPVQATPSPQAADAFKRFNVSPADFDYDPKTDTIKRKPSVMGRVGADIDKALEPITTYPSTQRQMAVESRDQVFRGAKQVAGYPVEDGGKPGSALERFKGAANIGLGGTGYVLSPINAALRTFLGKPLEENTGLSKEYTEFAAGLALPIIGFGKTPKSLQAIFSPETVSPEAMEAAGLIRMHTGRAARDTEVTAQNIEAYQKPVSKLPPAEQLGIMHYIEGTGPAPRTPQMRALSDTLKDAFEARKAKLQQMPAHAQMAFVDEYFPHFWKDPGAAAPTGRGGLGRQGSGASLKARSIPTIAEGLKRGLTPLTTNPLEATMRYVTSMDKFIATQNVLQAAKDTGIVIYRKPDIVGASGHPGSNVRMSGYTKLEGRGSRNAMGEDAYAPTPWARVYNNYISRGFDQFGAGEYGDMYNTLRRAANATTQTLLSFSGYHAFTVAEATMSNQMAKAVSDVRHISPVQMAKDLGKWSVAPVSYAARGKTFRDMYLGKAPMSPADKEIIDLITDAGGRMSGTKHALDYESSALGSYLTSFRRGRLRGELETQGRDIAANPLSGTARTLASNIGRVMDTFNQPLFQHYIPSIKNAAAYENMGQWLKQNPGATAAEKLAAARKVVDSVDNRFGEMIHDNIFWNRIAKQTAMLTMLSYSWNVGGWRELGGGVRDAARTVARGQPLTAKTDYIVGMTINWGIMSAVYQKLKTGEGPKDIHDLVAPRTGGVDERTGEPERIIPPGIMKDVFGYYEHPFQEALNKLNPALKMATQTVSNRDWRDDPIFSPKKPEEAMLEHAPDWLAEYMDYIVKTASPIQLGNLSKGPEEGSALNSVELALGVRKAPRQMVDPDGYEKMMYGIRKNKWRMKLQHDKKEQQRYGGTD